MLEIHKVINTFFTIRALKLGYVSKPGWRTLSEKRLQGTWRTMICVQNMVRGTMLDDEAN